VVDRVRRSDINHMILKNIGICFMFTRFNISYMGIKLDFANPVGRSPGVIGKF